MYNDKFILIIVAYNPVQSDICWMNFLSSELPVLIINNGEKISNIKNVYNCKKNYGMAGALRLGLYYAKSKFNYAILLDQDTRFDIDNLRYIMKNTENFPKDMGLLFANYNNVKSKNIFINKKISLLSGTILKLKNYKIIGNYNSRYFMEYFDLEYCLRSINHGFKNYMHRNWIINQKFGDNKCLNILFKTFNIENHNSTRHYYRGKNFRKLIEVYYKTNKIDIFILGKNQFKNLIQILFFEKKSFDKIYSFFSGFLKLN